MSETGIYRQSHCASAYNWQPERPCLVEDAALASLGVQNMLTSKPKTKILVDGGDPDETLRVKKLLGFVDGQTTNPSLIAYTQNPFRALRTSAKPFQSSVFWSGFSSQYFA